MQDVDDVQLGADFDQLPDRGADSDDALTETLAAMSGHEEDSLVLGKLKSAVPRSPAYLVQCVNHRVSDDGDRVCVQVRRFQVVPGASGRRVAERRDLIDEDAMHLFRERVGEVAGPKSRLDVGDRNAGVESSERSAKIGRRVAFDDHEIRLGVIDAVSEAREHRRKNGGEPSILWRDVDPVGGFEAPLGECLRQDVTLLADHAEKRPKTWGRSERSDERGELDDLRSRAHH